MCNMKWYDEMMRMSAGERDCLRVKKHRIDGLMVTFTLDTHSDIFCMQMDQNSAQTGERDPSQPRSGLLGTSI